jgi:hypothetical protein
VKYAILQVYVGMRQLGVRVHVERRNAKPKRLEGRASRKPQHRPSYAAIFFFKKPLNCQLLFIQRFFCCFFVVLGLELRAYYLKPLTSPFCDVFILRQGLPNFFPGLLQTEILPISAS